MWLGGVLIIKTMMSDHLFCIQHFIKEITTNTVAFMYEKVSRYHDNNTYMSDKV